MELICWLPEVGFSPDQATVAAQLAALLEDQVSIVEPPAVTELGAALSETVGAEPVGGGGDPGGGDPGGGVFPLALSAPPPPQAARLNAHSKASNGPQRTVIGDWCSFLVGTGGGPHVGGQQNCEDIFGDTGMPNHPTGPVFPQHSPARMPKATSGLAFVACVRQVSVGHIRKKRQVYAGPTKPT
jgi:hypothetical protein